MQLQNFTYHNTIAGLKQTDYFFVPDLEKRSAEVKKSVDYFTFGMQLPGRNGGDDYRFGFGGMEGDPEIKGDGNSYDFGARLYDPRVGRWLSRDPLEGKYSDLSPYSFVANCPLVFIDPDGKRIEPAFTAKDKKAYDAVLIQMQSYPLIQANMEILSSFNNMPNTKKKINSQAYAAFYLMVSVRAMTASEFKATGGMASGYSTAISKSTKKVMWNGEVAHEYFTTEIVIGTNGMNYGTIAEEFLHAGQKLYYMEQDAALPNEISIELEAKVIKVYSIWEQNQEMTAPELWNKMVGLGIATYELDILFNFDIQTNANGTTTPINVTFDPGVVLYFEQGGDVAFADAVPMQNALEKAGSEVEKTYQGKSGYVANQKIDSSFKYFKQLLSTAKDEKK